MYHKFSEFDSGSSLQYLHFVCVCMCKSIFACAKYATCKGLFILIKGVLSIHYSVNIRHIRIDNKFHGFSNKRG